MVDRSIGERDSHLWDLWSGRNDREPFPGVKSRKRLYLIPPRTTLSFRRQFRTSLLLPLEIIFNSTPKSSTQRTKTNQNACLKKKK